jgi:hypothetical protein
LWWCRKVFPATGAATAPDANPVVMRIVRLLRAPMIESRSRAGHRRKMTSAQLAAQSTSSRFSALF